MTAKMLKNSCTKEKNKKRVKCPKSLAQLKCEYNLKLAIHWKNVI